MFIVKIEKRNILNEKKIFYGIILIPFREIENRIKILNNLINDAIRVSQKYVI